MPTPFTIMTWNLENLFIYRKGSKVGPKSQAIYDQKLRNLATIIRSVDPDVVAAQEIGDVEAFEALQGALDGAFPHRSVSKFPDDRRIRVGILSKLPLREEDHLSPFPEKAIREIDIFERTKERAAQKPETTILKTGRGVLRVTIDLNGQPMHIITAHMKSKLVTYPNGRHYARDEYERARGTGLALIKRAAEAVAIRVYVTNLIAGNEIPLILLGDLNDLPDAVTTQMLLGPLDGDLERADQGDDTRLYNLVDLIPADRRYSRVYRKNFEMIDHIMVTRDLRLTNPRVDSFVSYTEAITESVENRRDKTLSDHAPVIARFQLP